MWERVTSRLGQKVFSSGSPHPRVIPNSAMTSMFPSCTLPPSSENRPANAFPDAAAGSGVDGSTTRTV